MLCLDNIKIEVECQGFKTGEIGISPEKDKSILVLESTRRTEDVRCQFCRGNVYIHGQNITYLSDIPIWYGIPLQYMIIGHRYKCLKCCKTFVEEVPFRYPGTRVTIRAANWIKGYLKNKLSIRAIQALTGIHWETIRNIQREYMKEQIEAREQELKQEDYKPKYLAVDEFAIHKGHSYATSVMDLETGDVIWVGKGRTLVDFKKFFEETDPSVLSAVIAVAMDMNASYNKLFTKYLPNAEIVYDRYHMQAQFGKEVLGVVRLEEARKHKLQSKEILNSITDETEKDDRRKLKSESKAQSQEYSKLKKSRWTLLMNSDKLSDRRAANLSEILENHHDLAVCYAMKEQMCELFKLTERSVAEEKWIQWFKAAKESEIPALVNFARLKEKRLPGLIAHASYPISTGKLEGFNNKIKVAKRIGYGYRDEDYFFLLVRFISLPSSRSFHTFP